jgi:hypothetical protein
MESKTIEITMKHEEPIHVTSVNSVNPNFEIELKTVEAGKRYELLVRPTNTDTQRIGLITIETDCAIKRHANQRAFTVVRTPTLPIQE